MEYANVIWDDCSINEAELLENVQYGEARVVSGAMRGTGRARVLRELAWEKLETKRSIHKVVTFYKITDDLSPTYLRSILTCDRAAPFLRSGGNFKPIAVPKDLKGLPQLPCGTASARILEMHLHCCYLRDMYDMLLVVPLIRNS